LLWPLAFVASVLIARLTVIAIFVPGAAQALGTFFAVARIIGFIIGMLMQRMRMLRRYRR